MDPTTRRFELLQLEFDSATARVSDITEQIPISATEPSLMGQKFETLTNLKGMELIAEEYIRLYVESAGVVVAVPTTTKEKGEAVARMATPILSNKKVHQMVRMCMSVFLIGIPVLVLVFTGNVAFLSAITDCLTVLLWKSHRYSLISHFIIFHSLPLQLTSSGLEIADLPEVRNKDVPPPPTVSIKPEEGEEVTSPSASASAAPVPTLNEEEPAEALSPAKKTRAIEFNLPEGDDLLVDDLLEEPEEEETKPEVQPSSKKPSSSGTGIVSFIAFLAIFVHLIQQIHIHYTTPLGPGAILSPGRTRGYCGIHSFSSGDCAPASMSMSDKGVFTVLDEASGDIVYQLKGKDAVCGSNPSCIPGLAIDGKGKVKINGSKAKVVVKAKVKLQPWPFAKGVVVPKRKAVVK
jgi:hypothetical protein